MPRTRPAAEVFGERALAAVLTGGGCDGTDGLQAVRGRGGFVIAQDEATAEVFAMPYSATLTRKVDLVLPLGRIAFDLETLAAGDTVGAGRVRPGGIRSKHRPPGTSPLRLACRHPLDPFEVEPALRAPALLPLRHVRPEPLVQRVGRARQHRDG